MNKQLLEQFKRGEVILYTPTFEDMKAFLKWCKKQSFISSDGDIYAYDIYKLFNNVKSYCGFAIDKNKHLIFSYAEQNKFEITEKDLEPDKQEFTKDDLHAGMVVETWEGTKYLKCSNFHLIMLNNACRELLQNYSDDLKHKTNGYSDVMKVYTTNNLIQVLEGNYDSLRLVWERDAVDWSTVKVDTKILVQNSNNELIPRYFSEYDKENDNASYFAHGTDSFTNNGLGCFEIKSKFVKLYKGDK